MQISKMLLRPSVDRLENEFRSLDKELGVPPTTPESLELKNAVQRRIRQVEMLNVALSYLNRDAQGMDPRELQASFRRLKLELRFARRKWKRLSAYEERIRKQQDKGLHVSNAA